MSGVSIFAAASKWLSQHNFSAARHLLVPGIIAGASVSLSRSVLLAETCYVGACVDPSVSRRLVWASLSPQRSPSVSQGCVHVTLSSRGPPSASRGFLCTCFSSPGWSLRRWASVDLFPLPASTLCVVGFVCICFVSA